MYACAVLPVFSFKHFGESVKAVTDTNHNRISTYLCRTVNYFSSDT